MNAQSSDRPMTTRNAALHWLLWSCELAVTVLVSTLLVVGALLLVYVFLEAPVDPAVGGVFGLIMAAIYVAVFIAVLRWFLRGRKLPLDARRLHRGSVAIGAFAHIFVYVIGAMYVKWQFGDDATDSVDSVMVLAAVLVAWVFHRLLFANLKQWTGLVDDRTFNERYRPAQHFVAAIALLMLSIFNMHFLLGREEPINEPSLLLVGAPLLGVIVFYKVTITIIAWRIRRKLAAAEPPAAREGGAT